MTKFSELYRLLEANGWKRTKGKRHHKYVHPNYNFSIPIGRHESKEVPTGTLKKILKDAELQGRLR